MNLEVDYNMKKERHVHYWYHSKKLEHKEHIMANLRNLKHPLDKFKGMSISHNLHPKEREVNKRMVEEAKQEHAANRSEDVESCRFLVVG